MGVPGATGPATTVYQVKLTGDPNQDCDSSRDDLERQVLIIQLLLPFLFISL